jgi:hypothetical protein
VVRQAAGVPQSGPSFPMSTGTRVIMRCCMSPAPQEPVNRDPTVDVEVVGTTRSEL